jgi:hypothetical protein
LLQYPFDPTLGQIGLNGRPFFTNGDDAVATLSASDFPTEGDAVLAAVALQITEEGVSSHAPIIGLFCPSVKRGRTIASGIDKQLHLAFRVTPFRTAARQIEPPVRLRQVAFSQPCLDFAGERVWLE